MRLTIPYKISEWILSDVFLSFILAFVVCLRESLFRLSGEESSNNCHFPFWHSAFISIFVREILCITFAVQLYLLRCLIEHPSLFNCITKDVKKTAVAN